MKSWLTAFFTAKHQHKWSIVRRFSVGDGWIACVEVRCDDCGQHEEQLAGFLTKKVLDEGRAIVSAPAPQSFFLTWKP